MESEVDSANPGVRCKRNWKDVVLGDVNILKIICNLLWLAVNGGLIVDIVEDSDDSVW